MIINFSLLNKGVGVKNVKKNILEINRNWGTQISLLIALILLMILFSSTSKYFFTFNNFLNIGQRMSVMGIMAVGCSVALIVGMLDVSQYSILAFVGSACVLLDRAGWDIGFVFLFAILAGLLLGAVNGFIVTVLKINPIIGTIATGMVFRGLTYMITNSRTLSVAPETKDIYMSIGRGSLLEIPITFLIMLGVYLIIFIVLKYTRFGRYIYAVGGNSQASFLSGVNLKKIRFGALMISGLTAGLGGFLLLTQLASFQPNTGSTALLDIIAAVLLGGIGLSGGKGRLTGTILGVVVIIIIQNGMTIMGIQTYWQMIVRGSIIIIAIFVNVIRGGGFKY